MNDLILKARLYEQEQLEKGLGQMAVNVFDRVTGSSGDSSEGATNRNPFPFGRNKNAPANQPQEASQPQEAPTQGPQDLRPGQEEMNRRANSNPNAGFDMGNMGDAMSMFDTSTPASQQNRRVRTGGAVMNTLGAVRDAGSAMASGNLPTASNRAAAQRDRTGMSQEEQSSLVGQQDASMFSQQQQSKQAGQNAGYAKLMQNAPGLASDQAKQTMGNIQSGQDPLANSQTGVATGGSATNFMGQFASGVGNLIGQGMNAYNTQRANQSNVGAGSAGQGIPQASLPQASTTGTPVNQAQPKPNASGGQSAQNQQGYDLGEAATRAAGDKAIASNQEALAEAEKRSNTKGGIGTGVMSNLLTGGMAGVARGAYNAYQRQQGRQDMTNAQNQQRRLMAGDTSAIQASEDILDHYYGIHKARLEITDRRSTEVVRLAYR